MVVCNFKSESDNIKWQVTVKYVNISVIDLWQILKCKS